MPDARKIAIHTALFSIAGNIILAAAKAITGIMGNSFALIADAIESTTDIFASILVLFGIKYATKPPDYNHPYGHGKAEALITFAVVGFLVISATIIAIHSIANIQTPHKSPELFTLPVLALIIIIKEFFFRIVNTRSRKINSTSLKAEAWHHRSDAITSLLAFIGISIALLAGDKYEAADDWAALAASGFILYNAYGIFRPALGEIMDEHLHDELINEIRQVAQNTDGVFATEKCLVRKNGMQYHADLHLIVDGDISVKSGHQIAHNVKKNIKQSI
ncbi:MAG: cation diffusion facilitator family transporter, partial [Chitinophagales bacterium]